MTYDKIAAMTEMMATLECGESLERYGDEHLRIVLQETIKRAPVRLHLCADGITHVLSEAQEDDIIVRLHDAILTELALRDSHNAAL